MWDMWRGGYKYNKNSIHFVYNVGYIYVFTFFSGGLVNHTINVSVAHNTFLISLYFFFKKKIYINVKIL